MTSSIQASQFHHIHSTLTPLHSAGSIYSSASDLLTFGRAILKSTLLSPRTTRAWLKPHAHTASLGLSVGAPWEILRTQMGTPANSQVVDLYTKGGTFNEYSSLLVLVPEHDLVLTLLVAGPDASHHQTLTFSSQILSAVLPTFETAAKSQAQQTYAGTYACIDGGEEQGNLTLAQDSGPGLSIIEWSSQGTDMLKLFPLLPLGYRPAPISARLYPTNIGNETSTSWRAILQSESPRSNDEDARLIYHDIECISWMRMDGVSYGYNAIDDFVFHFDSKGDGSVVSLESRALRKKMVKMATSSSSEGMKVQT